MELLKKEKSWFLSKDGIEKFSTLSSLEERTIFIYSYLKIAVNKRFEKDNTLFKMAFFFADAIYNSKEEYATYPEIISEDKNPFVVYLVHSDLCYDNEKLYIIFTSILNKRVNTQKSDEWIYDKKLLESEDWLEELCEKGVNYLPKNSMDMVEPSVYEIDKALAFSQLELVWLYLK